MAGLTVHTARAKELTCVETRLPVASLEVRLKMMPTRAAICVREGMPLRAIALMTQLIGHKPTDPIAYLNRGTLYLALGKYEKAITNFSQVIGDKPITQVTGDRPAGAVAMGRRGQAYEAMGEASRALDDYRAALEAYPKLEAAREGFARIKTKQRLANGHP